MAIDIIDRTLTLTVAEQGPSGPAGPPGPAGTTNYNELLNRPVLATVATTGSYNDLLDTPASIATDWADITNKPLFAPIALSGSYADLVNAPVLSAVATSGSYADLTGTPTLATVATTGSYNDLLDKPVIDNVVDWAEIQNNPITVGAGGELSVAGTAAQFVVPVHTTLPAGNQGGLVVHDETATGGSRSLKVYLDTVWQDVNATQVVDWADVTNKPTFATVATSGNYIDLAGTPTLATVATTGAYTDLTGTPTLATVATTGAYGDLTGTPDLTGYLTAIQQDINPILGGTLSTGGFDLNTAGTVNNLGIYGNTLTVDGTNTDIYADGILGLRAALADTQLHVVGLNTTFHNSPITLSGTTTLNGFAFPTTDGSSGQLLSTDGAGNLVFADAPQAASSVKPNLVLRDYVLDGGWIAATNTADNQNYLAATWAPELKTFVAVAESGAISHSTDGVTWTQVASTKYWTDVAWSPELSTFVAVQRSGGSNRAASSTDGITWWDRTIGAQSWSSVCWSAELGLFAAVSFDGTDRVATSPDGITWTLRNCPAESWQSVTWSPELGLFAAVANSGIGSRVMTSPDGITWTMQTTPADSSWETVRWIGDLGIFVAVASYSGVEKIMTSPDGITWTVRHSGGNNLYDVAWAGDLGTLVAIGSSTVLTSSDGVAWTSRTNPGTDRRALLWSRELGIFVSFAFSGTERIKTTTSAWAYPYAPAPSAVLADETAPTLNADLNANAYAIVDPVLSRYAVEAETNTIATGAVILGPANIHHLVLTENVTGITMPTLTEHTQHVIYVVQDATGGRTVAGWAANVRWSGGEVPTITATANAIDVVVLSYHPTLDVWLGDFRQGYA